MTLTNAQIYTLRRLNTGTRYLMQGNGKKGWSSVQIASVRWDIFRLMPPVCRPSSGWA